MQENLFWYETLQGNLGVTVSPWPMLLVHYLSYGAPLSPDPGSPCVTWGDDGPPTQGPHVLPGVMVAPLTPGPLVLPGEMVAP